MDEKISTRIKRIRENLKYSQKQMSDHTNISQSNLAKIEKGNLNPSLEFMSLLNEKYRIDLTWLITGIGEMYLLEKNIDENQAIRILLKGKQPNENVKKILESLGEPVLQNEMANASMIAREKYSSYFENRKKEKNQLNLGGT